MKTRVLFFSFFTGVFATCITPERVCAQNITTVAGCGIGNDSLAMKAELILPMKVAFDNAGNAYVADGGNNMIRKVDAGGVITTYAGNGNGGYTGDGGPATAATFLNIYSVAVDRTGNVYVVDAGNSTIRKVNTAGMISTFAGTGTAGYNGDSIAATAAQLNEPSDAAADTFGNIYIADRENYLVRKINTSGMITNVPGTVGLSGVPFRIALDKKENLFIATYGNWNILKDSAGIINTIAGTGAYGYSGDGGPATAATFSAPCGLAIDTMNNVYLSDIDNSRIRMVNATTGIITTIAGNGITGYRGDGGPSDSAEINLPEGVSFDANNNLYIADLWNNRIRLVTPAGVISTFAGQNTLFDEGYPGVNSEFTNIQNMASDVSGNIYIPDFFNNRVRKLNALTGIITTVAGDGVAELESGFTGDGGPATTANLVGPSAVTLDAAGNLYICEQSMQRIRKVNASGIITTIAGNDTMGYVGSGIPATSAEFAYPTGIAVDAAGNVYICDNNNQRIRKINTSGIITTIAGDGVAGGSGDGGAATDARLSYPDDVAVDAGGNVYITDQGNNSIRMVDTTGVITTIAGIGTAGYSGDAGPAAAAQLYDPLGIKVDQSGNIIFADAGNNAVRVINSEGIINTIAGVGSPGFSGDGGPAVSAQLNYPFGVAEDLSGNVYIADNGNYRVRKVNISYLSVPSTVATKQSVLVYPNPTKGTINIVNAANSLIIINDIAGNEVMKERVTNATQPMDISGLASGVYLVQVTSQNGQSKIVKVTKE